MATILAVSAHPAMARTVEVTVCAAEPPHDAAVRCPGCVTFNEGPQGDDESAEGYAARLLAAAAGYARASAANLEAQAEIPAGPGESPGEVGDLPAGEVSLPEAPPEQPMLPKALEELVGREV